MSSQDGDRANHRAPLTSRARRYVPRSIRRSTRGFLLVLALLVTIYVVAEVLEESRTAQAVMWGLAFVAFLVTLRAIGAAPRTVYINAVVMAVILIAAITGLAVNQDALTEPAGLFVSGFALVAPVLILRHVMRRDEATIDVIFGALSVYVFLGIDFGILYDVLLRIDAGAFVTASGDVASMFYFSFTTLTTVGFGDVTPVSDWAQALTVVEALTGQIVLVVFVARLVGMQISQSRQ